MDQLPAMEQMEQQDAEPAWAQRTRTHTQHITYVRSTVVLRTVACTRPATRSTTRAHAPKNYDTRGLASAQVRLDAGHQTTLFQREMTLGQSLVAAAAARGPRANRIDEGPKQKRVERGSRKVG